MDQTRTKTYTGKWRPVILIFTMCAAALFAALSVKAGMLVAGALFLAVMGGIFSVLFLTGTHELLPVIGASASIVILQILGGFAASLMGVITMIAAFVLAYGIRKRAAKTMAVATVSVTLGVGFLLVAAILYAADGGSLVPSDLLDAYNQFFRQMKITLSESVYEMVNSMDENLLILYAQMDITKETLLDTYLSSMEYFVDLVQLMVPGIFMFAVQILGYLEVSAFRLTARFARVEAVLPETRWFLYPTQVSCIFYIVVASVYIVASFFTDSTSSFMVVMSNLWLALLPTMLFCGVRVLLTRLKHPLYRMSTIIILLVFAFGLFMVPSVAIQIALFLLSFLGAQTVSMQHSAESGKNQK